jgi:hypothetical protein
MVDPFSVVTGTFSLVKAAREISDQLHDLTKRVKDRETKQEIEHVLDKVSDLKHSAARLEDENRDLLEKLRFKSDDYKFETPFWYPKDNPELAFCPKCFAQQTLGPMGAPGQGCNDAYRRCLVCYNMVQVAEPKPPTPMITRMDPII